MAIGSLETYAHLLAALAVLLLPGAAIYSLAAPRSPPSRAAGLADALAAGAGLSIAFWPLLLLYLSLAGLRLNALVISGVLFAAAICIAWRVWTQRRSAAGADASGAERADGGQLPSILAFRFRIWPPIQNPKSKIQNPESAVAALAGLTLLALAFRLSEIAGLTVPMWGDSLHHTMVAAIIRDTGQVPQNYLPYVPVETFTYHFGFHTLPAALTLLAGLPVERSVLLIGQLLIVLAIPAAYYLNRQLLGSPVAGAAAALLTGFVSIMPAYYVNWGRYTQLAGQVLLAVAAALVFRAASARSSWRDTALAAMCVGGLALVHYRMLIFLALFGIALGLWQLALLARRKRALAASWLRGAAIVGGGLLLSSPWLANLVANYFEGLFRRVSTVSSEYLSEYNNPGTIPFYVGTALPLLALAGVAITLWEAWRLSRSLLRNSGSGAASPHRALPVWAAALAAATWAGLLVAVLWVVPGAIGSYAVATAFYIPLCALGGYAIWKLWELSAGLMRLNLALLSFLLLASAPVLSYAFGTWRVADQARHQYVHEGDLIAFDWIRNNTPTGARFLISSQFSYLGRGVTATDGGMWLPLLAGRNVSVPALNTWMERPAAPDFFTDTVRLAAYTQPAGDAGANGAGNSTHSTQASLVERGVIDAALGLSDPEVLGLMKKLGITHVYSGVAAGARAPRLDLAALRRDSRHYELVYFDEAWGVYVFRVRL